MKLKIILAGLAVFTATLGSSYYTAAVGRAEIVHFWVAAPAGYVARPKVFNHTGTTVRVTPIVIDLDRRGFLKRWLQPEVEALSTHWIHNVGKQPLRIRMELASLTIPVAWEVNANLGYDHETHTFTEPLPPGESVPNLAIDWIFRIPREFLAERRLPPGGRTVYSGGLKLTDADSGELLTYIPIRIGRGIAVSSGSKRNADSVQASPESHH